MRGTEGERGDTLIEIMMSVVILGIIASAFFASLFASSSASATHRDFVNADTVLRNAAELTKSQVRDTCMSGATKFSVDYSSLGANGITPPTNVTLSCPPITGPVTGVTGQIQPVTLTVSWPAHTESMTVDVRTP